MISRAARNDTELVLGVDIGTSSSKGVLARPDGEIVRSGTRPHRVSMPRPGWFEHDAEEVWWGDVVALIRELGSPVAGTIRAVCVSGIGPCALPATADGRPLRPAILYGVDTRADEEIDELDERYGRSEILDRGGSPLTSQAIGPKLRWLQRHEPDVWAATHRWFMASSFIVHRLTGEYVLDHHSASQSDPLYNIGARAFNNEWSDEIAPGLELPRLVEPAEVVGEVTPSAAAATGLSPGTLVTGGTIDALAEAISVGVEQPGELMLMYGSTIFMIKFAEEAIPHPSLWTTVGHEPETFAIAAGMATGGALTAWFRQLTGEDSFSELFDGARAVSAGSDGLLVLPYFAGERTPLFDSRARGMICGLTLNHTRAQAFRAILEGVAYGVRHNVETIEGSAGRARRVVAVGGGAEGGLWPQIVSDICGLRQELPVRTVGASYGDALLAARGAGLVSAAARWNRTARVIEPNPDHASVYDRLYRSYRRLYPATVDLAHDLADLQTAQPL